MQTSPNNQEPHESVAPVTPDDQGIVHLDGHIRIYDPNTDKTLVEARE